MKIGIVTTWFERGAAYVSKQFMDVLQKTDEVFIYARGGENYAKGNPIWDLPNVWWGKRSLAHMMAYGSTFIFKSDFKNWVKNTQVEIVLFNEQQWFYPVVWAKEMGLKTVAYIDYYTESMLPLYDIYDCLVCNTKRHAFAFRNHKNSRYLKWGTNVDLYKPSIESHEKITFFHSAGMAPIRKGTDLLLWAFYQAKERKKAKLVLHSQVSLNKEFPELSDHINELKKEGSLEIIEDTVPAPGLYYKGDVYVYPSRLDGIGLTLMEAISSGMAIITSDNAPMNEFVEPNFGDVCPIEYYYCRQDGYYWPMCVCSSSSLSVLLDQYINGEKDVNRMKKRARAYALNELDFNRNFERLHTIIKDTPYFDDYKNVVSKINRYENLGFKRLAKFMVPLCYLYIKFLKKK